MGHWAEKGTQGCVQGGAKQGQGKVKKGERRVMERGSGRGIIGKKTGERAMSGRESERDVIRSYREGGRGMGRR